MLDTYHAAFDARRTYEMEYRLQRDDGAWRWLLERGTPNIGPNGEFEGYIGTCIDITEHRETVEALRESRARFKTLTESLPQMIWTCTRDGYTDYLSRQWLDYTGRSEAQQLGKGWLEQVHPDDRVKVEMQWSLVVGTGDTFDMSYRIRRVDGVYRWFKTRAVPLRDPAGRILKWFGSNTDIEDFVNASNKVTVQLERMQLLDRITHAIGAHQEARKVFEVVLRSLEAEPGHRLLLRRPLRHGTAADHGLACRPEERADRRPDRPRRECAAGGGRRGARRAACRASWSTSRTWSTCRLRHSARACWPADSTRWWQPR